MYDVTLRVIAVALTTVAVAPVGDVSQLLIIANHIIPSIIRLVGSILASDDYQNSMIVLLVAILS